MKKLLTMLLCLSLLLVSAMAEEETRPEAYDRLTVGTTSAMSGHFFTELWGSNTADLDVAELLHGCNLVIWEDEVGAYNINPTVVSGLALEHDPVTNGRTYHITLYNDLYYSDGTQITAWDYAFSLLLSNSPVLAELGAQIRGSSIEGADAYARGETDAITGITVLDNNTLRVAVKTAYQPYFYELALLRCNPYPISVIAPGYRVMNTENGVALRLEDGTQAALTADMLRETLLDPQTGYMSHPSVVSGPYTLVSYDAEAERAEFAINPYYKGESEEAMPLIPTIIYTHVTNADAPGMLERDEIDLFNKALQAETITESLALVAEGEHAASNYPRSGLSFITYCCEKPALGEAAVRQAIAMALDKDTLLAECVGNYGLSVNGFYGLGQWMYQLLNGVEAPLQEPAENATAEEREKYEADLALWETLTMEQLKTYEFDLEAAAALLEADGWTLNRKGGAFDANRDDVRCKELNGALVALEFTLIYPEGNSIGTALEGAFADNLAKIGVKLTIEPRVYQQLLETYYAADERDCDMIYLATNFDVCFDPTELFRVGGAGNRSHIADAQLAQLAAELNLTEPGDVVSYCQKWIELQTVFTEVLPMIPVYSNVYFDIYTITLQRYEIGSSSSWAQAVIGAYRSDVMYEVEEDFFTDEEDFFTDDEDFFVDDEEEAVEIP